MAKEHRVNVRVGGAHLIVKAMAEVRTSEAVEVTASDVYRELLAEALAARAKACSTGHRGPIWGDTCGHCGRTA